MTVPTKSNAPAWMKRKLGRLEALLQRVTERVGLPQWQEGRGYLIAAVGLLYVFSLLLAMWALYRFFGAFLVHVLLLVLPFFFSFIIFYLQEEHLRKFSKGALDTVWNVGVAIGSVHLYFDGFDGLLKLFKGPPKGALDGELALRLILVLLVTQWAALRAAMAFTECWKEREQAYLVRRTAAQKVEAPQLSSTGTN
jgi:hypothetical protein